LRTSTTRAASSTPARIIFLVRTDFFNEYQGNQNLTGMWLLWSIVTRSFSSRKRATDKGSMLCRTHKSQRKRVQAPHKSNQTSPISHAHTRTHRPVTCGPTAHNFSPIRKIIFCANLKRRRLHHLIYVEQIKPSTKC
jgi:hypothetical protein